MKIKLNNRLLSFLLCVCLVSLFVAAIAIIYYTNKANPFSLSELYDKVFDRTVRELKISYHPNILTALNLCGEEYQYYLKKRYERVSLSDSEINEIITAPELSILSFWGGLYLIRLHGTIVEEKQIIGLLNLLSAQADSEISIGMSNLCTVYCFDSCAYPILCNILEDKNEDPAKRVIACFALNRKKYYPKIKSKMIETFLNDPCDEVRFVAIQTLACMDNTEDLFPMIRQEIQNCLQENAHPDSQVFYGMLQFVFSQGSEEAVDFSIHLIEDGVRSYAYNEKGDIPHMIRKARDPYKEDCAYPIVLLVPRLKLNPEQNERIERLIKSSDKQVSRWAKDMKDISNLSTKSDMPSHIIMRKQ